MNIIYIIKKNNLIDIYSINITIYLFYKDCINAENNINDPSIILGILV